MIKLSLDTEVSHLIDVCSGEYSITAKDETGHTIQNLNVDFIHCLGLSISDFTEGQEIELAVKKGEDPRLDMEGRSA